MMDKLSVARALRELGLLLEAQGENPFKVRAYAAGARALEDAEGELPELVESGRLGELRGIGEALQKKITELHRTGHTPMLDRLRAEVPRGLVELAQVPALGPKKLALLREALGISSVDELMAACRAGRVRSVKGFGEKSEAHLLEALAAWRARQEAPRRFLLPDAVEVGERARLLLGEGGPPVELAGEARRGLETVAGVVLLAQDDLPAASVARLEVLGGLGLPVTWVAAPASECGAALLHATGPEEHLARLRELAAARGLRLDARGLWRSGVRAPLPTPSEEEIYEALGLPFIEPELRADGSEVDLALRGGLARDLVTAGDVRGYVHCHTDWSDGRASIEAMALAAEALGAEYLTVTDHSPAAAYAGGLSVERLRGQAEEIARVQERVKVKLLRGIESDILEDGRLDLPDAALRELDVVVASVHQRYRMDEAAMTHRLVAAMRLPLFKIWGHALGRLLLEREPFPCRVEEVLDALAASRGAVEVNGDPHRLEADPPLLRLARERNIPVVLSVDAHSPASLGYLRWAVTTARRAGVRRGEVLNTLPAREFAAAVRP